MTALREYHDLLDEGELEKARQLARKYPDMDYWHGQATEIVTALCKDLNGDEKFDRVVDLVDEIHECNDPELISSLYVLSANTH